MAEQPLDTTTFDKTATTSPATTITYTDQDVLNQLDILFKVYTALPNRIAKEDANINSAMTLVKNVIAARRQRGV